MVWIGNVLRWAFWLQFKEKWMHKFLKVPQKRFFFLFFVILQRYDSFIIIEIVPLSTSNMSLTSCKPFPFPICIKDIIILSSIKTEFLISVCCFFKCGPNFSHKGIEMYYEEPFSFAWTCFMCKNQAKLDMWIYVAFQKPRTIHFFLHMTTNNAYFSISYPKTKAWMFDTC
jgi:hypothetical protein